MKAQDVIFRMFASILMVLVAMPLMAQEIDQPDKAELEKSYPTKRPYSPYAGRSFPTRVFWGDTHLHTSYSMDAGAFGARLTPKDAYGSPKGTRSPRPPGSG